MMTEWLNEVWKKRKGSFFSHKSQSLLICSLAISYRECLKLVAKLSELGVTVMDIGLRKTKKMKFITFSKLKSISCNNKVNYM